MDIKERPNWFNKFAALMDQNIRGVQYGVYGVAGLGFVIAMRSIRPFAKFKRPTDIPKHFVMKRIPCQGRVISVKPGAFVGDNPILCVDHFPLLRVPFTAAANPGLPLQISGVNITSNGFTWMHSLLVGSTITFTPLRVDDAVVHGLVHIDKNRNIGSHLVSIGFATVDGFDLALEKDAMYTKYYKGLLSAESRAERRGSGVWLDKRPSWIRQLMSRVRSLSRLSLA